MLARHFPGPAPVLAELSRDHRQVAEMLERLKRWPRWMSRPPGCLMSTPLLRNAVGVAYAAMSGLITGSVPLRETASANGLNSLARPSARPCRVR